MSLIHRAGTAFLAAALAVTVVSGAPSQAAGASRTPAGDSAHWLAGQLHHGVVHNGQFNFDDYGLSIDTATALRAIGGHPTAVKRTRTAMKHHVSDYTTDASFGLTDVFAGAIAKLLVFAQATGGGARQFGGADLVSALDDRVVKGGTARGRIQDAVDPSNTFGDSANAIGQVLAVRGLLGAHDRLAPRALRYLLLQQCGKGYFRLELGKVSSAHQGCTKKSPADSDVTSLAVIELWKYRHGHGALRAALAEAVAWLARHQEANGSFGGGPTTSAPNANSTGLAGWALGVTATCGRARSAAQWLAQHQVRGKLAGTKLAGERGAVAYNHRAMRLAQTHGITKVTRDQWRRATAQAGPALSYLSAKACG
jgi:hypothetical protein